MNTPYQTIENLLPLVGLKGPEILGEIPVALLARALASPKDNHLAAYVDGESILVNALGVPYSTAGSLGLQDVLAVGVSAGGLVITGLGLPTAADHAATKGYTDSALLSLRNRTRVKVTSTANVNLASALATGQSLDGVTLAAGDLVLVKNQSVPAQNGIYVCPSSGVASRSVEFDAFSEHAGLLCAVQQGTVGGDSLWLCTSNESGTLGSTAITFSKVGMGLLPENNLGDVTNATTARTNLGAISAGSVDTLSNKTLASPAITGGLTNGGAALTLPTTTGTLALDPQYAAPALVVEGDSLTTDQSNGTPVLTTWPFVISALIPTWKLRNVAIGGQSTPSAVVDCPNNAFPFFSAARVRNVFGVLMGTNDCNGADSAATIYANLETLAQGARAAGAKTFVVTVFPNGVHNSTAQAKRLALNTLIRANSHGYFDVVVDPCALAQFDAQTDATNTTYYQVDTTHLTQAGQNLLASTIYSAIGGLLATPSATPPGLARAGQNSDITGLSALSSSLFFGSGVQLLWPDYGIKRTAVGEGAMTNGSSGLGLLNMLQLRIQGQDTAYAQGFGTVLRSSHLRLDGVASDIAAAAGWLYYNSSSNTIRYHDGTAYASLAAQAESFSVHKNGVTQGSIADRTYTKVTWSAEEWDTANWFASDQFKPLRAGRYHLRAQVRWDSNSTSSRILVIYKNGAAYKLVDGAASVFIQGCMQIECLVLANGITDYFEVYVWQNSGVGTVSITGSIASTYFQGEYVGP